jgi:hypothetical protein
LLFLADSVFGVLPPCFLTIATAINDIRMFDAPDYDFIHDAFYKLAEEKGILLDGPLDLGEGVTVYSSRITVIFCL